MVESRLDRMAQLGFRQSCYFGRARSKCQLYLAAKVAKVAKVANLVLVAEKSGLPAGTGSGSNSWGTARTEAITSACHFLPAPVGQILISALLAPAHR